VPQLKPLLNVNNPIVDAKGKMVQFFREYLSFLGRNTVLVGTTAPEGVISASQYTLYIDETVPTAPVQYRKMLPSIGGDVKKGWVVV